MKNKLGQIKTGALISYFTIFFNILAGLLYTPWMVRQIGDSNYGLYTTAIALINLFLIDFGIGSAVSKFIAKFNAEGKTEEANYFFGTVIKLYCLIAAALTLVFLAVYFNINYIYTEFTEEELQIFRQLFIIACSYSIISFPFLSLNGILMANEKFIAIKFLNLLQKVLTVALIIIMLCLNMGVISLVLANAAVNLVIILLKVVVVKIKTPIKLKFRKDSKESFRELFSFSIWVTVVQLAERCIFSIAPTLLASIIGAHEIALFSLAASIEGYVYTFSEAINGMFLPRVTNFVHENKREDLNKLILKVGRIQSFLIVLICVGFLSVGDIFVELWLGSGYIEVYYCALWLILPSILDLPQQICRTTVLVTDKIKYQGFVYIAMAVINIAIMLILPRFMGVIGAGVAVCIAYLIRTFGMNIIYSKKLDIKMGEFYKRTFLPVIIPAIILFATGYLLKYFLAPTNWLMFLLVVVIMTAIYCLIIYFFVSNKEEKQMLKSFIINKSNKN